MFLLEHTYYLTKNRSNSNKCKSLLTSLGNIINILSMLKQFKINYLIILFTCNKPNLYNTMYLVLMHDSIENETNFHVLFV